MTVALTIAGSDSGGGAGIQADLKTFAALGVHGCCAITAVTAQNTAGVMEVAVMEPHTVRAQIDAVAADLQPAAVKTGMLAGAALIEAVVDALRRHALNVLVVDPVLAAHSGAPLLQDGALETLRTLLLPLATVLTPNIPEAELLLGRTITTLDDQREAAHDLSSLGACAVVIKGGHGQDPRRCVDVLCHRGKMIEIDSSRLDTANTHGGGCVFSAAITVYLARGHDVVAAVRGAHDFARRAIAAAWDAGAGAGPVNPLFQLGSIQN